MEKEFCSYEQSLALKELGFDEPCLGMFDEYKEFNCLGIPHNANILQGCTSRPLIQQTFRWFREKYPYRFYILPCSEHKKYLFEITLPSSIFYTSVEDEAYNTYEEAEQACLDKLIEITKNK